MDRPDTLSPRQIANRNPGLGYKAVLGAIRRGELHATEPTPGRYRVAWAEYRRWLEARPVAPADDRPQRAQTPPRRSSRRPSERGSFASLTAIEGGA